MLPSCESPPTTRPRDISEHIESREYSSANRAAGNEQISDGFREPKKTVTVGVGSCCVLLNYLFNSLFNILHSVAYILNGSGWPHPDFQR